MTDGPAWWQRGAIYQIYPRSFADSDGDGVGDLPGITSRLEHLAELGAEAIWLSPFYRSPMADFGYDVADYRDVDPAFGTLDDFDRLLEAAHARRIRVVVDWVPNHSSDRHEWFLESRSSRENPRRDWYVWRDGDGNGGPPNDWMSEFPAVGRGVELRRRDRAVVPALVHGRAARPQLGQPRGRGGDARHAALLARSRRRRLPDRRAAALAHDPLLRRTRARRAGTTRTGTRCTSGCAASAASPRSTRTGCSSARSRCRTCTAS